MNVNINPQADDYVWLRCEFEMNPEDLMLRSLSKKWGKTYKIYSLTRCQKMR